MVHWGKIFAIIIGVFLPLVAMFLGIRYVNNILFFILMMVWFGVGALYLQSYTES